VSSIIVSSTKNFFLSGEDFDQRVMTYFIQLLKNKTGKDAEKNLRREVERAKQSHPDCV
jgi:molecular chaperone DnaK (HSP70)